jgi:hypothetical protein
VEVILFFFKFYNLSGGFDYSGKHYFEVLVNGIKVGKIRRRTHDARHTVKDARRKEEII